MDTSRPRRKLWTPVVMVGLYWLAYAAIGLMDLPMFSLFLARLGALAVLLLGFTSWWLIRGPLRFGNRFLVIGGAIVCGVVTTLLLHPSVLPPTVMIFSLPAMMTAWTVWLLFSQAATAGVVLAGMLIIPVLAWTPGTLVRMEGLTGRGGGDFHWRWSRSSEEQFLAQQKKSSSAPPALAPPDHVLAVTDDDWPAFRGPQRDGVRTGVKIAADWQQHPPKLLWRKLVGPAWSSIVVIDGRLFTQEQRGEREVVSCFAADTGEPLWVYEDQSRFEEAMGGIGPRATPTFAEGRIYALGASGRLNCLDAASGEKIWSRDIVADASASLPMWGFSGAPLLVDGRVIIFAGGEKKQELLAYDAATGEIAWRAAAGKESYSSPQLATLVGQPQVLFVGNDYLGAFDPATGELLWKCAPGHKFGRPVIQPRQIGDSQVLVSFSPDEGTKLINVTHDGGAWQVSEAWATRDIKPDFSDAVDFEGYLYGFDGSIFCCVDLATGKRQWKRGRYGAGQVLLLADQPLLVVVTEDGEIVLLAANPNKHEELARLQAVEGKTWNHPVIARDRLYVRNAQEMACYQLQPLE